MLKYLYLKAISMIKYIGKDTNKLKDICSWIGKNYYCLNDHTSQGNLLSQWNSYQNSKCIFHRIRTNVSKICMESRNTMSSQKKKKKPFRKKTKLEVSHSLISNYFTAQIIKTKFVWYWNKNRKESLEKNHALWKINLQKRNHNIQLGNTGF